MKYVDTFINGVNTDAKVYEMDNDKLQTIAAEPNESEDYTSIYTYFSGTLVSLNF